MSFRPASTGSLLAFCAILALVLGLFLAGTYLAARRSGVPPARRTLLTAIAVLGYLGLLAVPPLTGVMEARTLPALPLFMAASLLPALAYGLSRRGAELAAGVPLVALVAFQGFRLPLELVLHAWGDQGTIPMTMTWSGQNFDVVSGVLALVCAPLASRWRAAGWIANLVGIALLVNVGRVVVLSSPLPFAWDVEPPLLLGLYLPYAWIASVCVGGALLGHVVLTRALLAPRA